MYMTRRRALLSSLALGAATVLAGCGASAEKRAPGSAARLPARRIVPEAVEQPVALSGAGASPLFVPLALFTSGYRATVDSGVDLEYRVSGSSDGIRQITERTADLGGSEGFLTDEQLTKAPDVLHIPLTMIGLVPTYNLPGIATSVRFSGAVLTDIYLGKIRRWNDQRLTALNPGTTLPDLEITPVYRSDSSYSTLIWTSYLSGSSPEWKTRVGVNITPTWPVGVGGRNSGGVATALRQTPGAIGYVLANFADENGLAKGLVQNPSGAFVGATSAGLTAAAESTAPSLPDDLRAFMLDAPHADAYPIAGFTYALVRRTISDPLKARALTNFLWWSLHDEIALDLQRAALYSPPPPAIVARVDPLLQSISVDGRPALALKG